MGVGTYANDFNENTDIAMFNAIVDSVMSGGVNVIDTCTSFLHSKSERIVNAALRFLTADQQYKREQLFIGTKSGYIADDADLG